MQKGLLGQKLKMPKRCIKRSYDHIGKRAPKNIEYSQNESIFKMAKFGHTAWAIALAKCSVWVKN